MQTFGDGLHVMRRTSGHGAPRRGAEDRQHPVVAEKHEQVARRIPQCVTATAGPHRRHQRRDEVRDEERRKSVPPQKCVQRLQIVGSAVVVEHPARSAVKSADLEQHSQIAGSGRMPRREKSACAQRPGVLQTAGFCAHRHRHVGFLGTDPELVEQAAQRRIGAVVVNEEGRVDTDDGAVPAVDRMGMCVTAQPGVGLVEGDAVTTGQHERSGQTGYTAADNRDRPTFCLRHGGIRSRGASGRP